LHDLFGGRLGSLQQFGYHIPEAALLNSRNEVYQDFAVSQTQVDLILGESHDEETNIMQEALRKPSELCLLHLRLTANNPPGAIATWDATQVAFAM
jgi:hypothetical protein